MSSIGERKTHDFIGAHERLRPLRDGIVVKVLPFKLSDTILAHWSGNAVRGEVVAIGKGRYPNIHRRGFKDGKDTRSVHESAHFRPTEVRVGQIVHLGGMDLGGYAFTKIYINHEEHVLATEQDIAAVEL